MRSRPRNASRDSSDTTRIPRSNNLTTPLPTTDSHTHLSRGQSLYTHSPEAASDYSESVVARHSQSAMASLLLVQPPSPPSPTMPPARPTHQPQESEKEIVPHNSALSELAALAIGDEREALVASGVPRHPPATPSVFSYASETLIPSSSFTLPDDQEHATPPTQWHFRSRSVLCALLQSSGPHPSAHTAPFWCCTTWTRVSGRMTISCCRRRIRSTDTGPERFAHQPEGRLAHKGPPDASIAAPHLPTTTFIRKYSGSLDRSRKIYTSFSNSAAY